MSQWADEKRRLSPEASAEPGRWNTSRAEYQRGIMDAYTDPSVREIVVMKSAQIGWTEILNNVVGYIIDQDPGPVLLTQPTLEMAQAWSKDRLAPMLRDTPALRGRVTIAKSRDASNTMLHKTFPGGHLTMAGANSPASLASRPVRSGLCDEVDRYPASAGEEGDPIKLIAKRATTFWNSKMLMGSTPTVEGSSRIAFAFERSDKRYYFVPCPHCGTMQRLRWKDEDGKYNVVWPKGEPEKAYYECEHCDGHIIDNDLPAMLAAGEWRATAPSKGIAGFHINELYSPWVSFGATATNFVESKDNEHLLKTWVNTALGETWKVKGEKPDWHKIRGRAENYPIMTVPRKACLLVAGIDTQDNRLAVVVDAYGRGKESWRVYHTELAGDPNQPEVWEALTNILNHSYKHESGVELRIVSAAIDSAGHRTQAVYNYVRKAPPNLIAVRGANAFGKPALGIPSKQDVTWQGEKDANGVELWPVGTDTIKSQIYGFLKVENHGPGYFHTPVGLSDAYYQQLTAEKLVTQTRAGVAYQSWVTEGRNEALDCTVYAYAAAVRVGLEAMDWDNLEAQINAQASRIANNQPQTSGSQAQGRRGVVSEVKI